MKDERDKYKLILCLQCGIGMAFREWGDFVSLWNTTAYSKTLVKSLKKEIRPITNGSYVGYKTFKVSFNDVLHHCSFFCFAGKERTSQTSSFLVTLLHL
jgi:hypothetical protein